jgi:hypothetical protein
VKETFSVLCQQLNSLCRQTVCNHGNSGKEGFVKSSMHIDMVVEYRFSNAFEGVAARTLHPSHHGWSSLLT